MSKTINISIDTSKYRMPTQGEIDNAKKFVLRRSNTASELGSIIDNILVQAAGEIAQICLKYNIPAKDFTMTANSQMFAEVEKVMDRIDAEIMELIQDYSLKVTNDKKKKKLLAAYIASLGKGDNNLQNTLDGYLYRYLYDLEAIIASMKLSKESGAKLTTAAIVAKIKSSQHSIYTTQEVRSAMSAKNIPLIQAQYIRTRGKHIDATGLSYIGASSSNANNVIRMAEATMEMAWMRYQGLDFEDMGVVGYVQMRGSSYPCAICDEAAHVYYDLVGIFEKPYEHINCKCYRVPLFRVDKNTEIEI